MIEPMKELLDRTRRIETRLTRYLADRGFDVESQKPVYDEHLRQLRIPSRKVALQECLDVLPDGDLVPVLIGTQCIGWITKGKVT